jgi:hypothetical protein
MALDKVSQTIQQFREDVLGRGGPQISSMYEVILSHNAQSPIVCYPLSIVVPGRQFIYYEHDLWGPSRKVPYKRGYTQCHMSFIVYQDWAERSYIENWMNAIIVNKEVDGLPVSSALTFSQNIEGQNATEKLAALANTLSGGGPLSADATFSEEYQDYIDYVSGTGSIIISFLNSSTKTPNRAVLLKEAFPAAISQMSMASDGSAYPTFNVTFQFNDYHYL